LYWLFQARALQLQAELADRPLQDFLNFCRNCFEGTHGNVGVRLTVKPVKLHVLYTRRANT